MYRSILAALLLCSGALPPALAGTQEERLASLLEQKLQRAPDRVSPAPVPGLFEARFGSTLFYVSGDAKYLFRGEVIDLDTGANLTEQQRAALRQDALRQVPDQEFITFAAPHEDYRITVFTDIDCGYCRKLHSEIDEYRNAGITVRYLAYPRAGMGSDSFVKAQKVWCADDPRSALTDAKAGKRVDGPRCRSPVERHMALGETLGVNGTPAIFLQDGTLVGGYMPAARLKELLDQRF